MLSAPAAVRVFLYTIAVDFRKSFNGLHGLTVEALKQDPLSGDWFVFLNRRRDRIKILAWDGDGFFIFYKQLQSGTYALPLHEGDSVTLTSQQLALLLSGVDLKQTQPRKRYQRVGGNYSSQS
ncbi:MAG: IS66 family insertion sequence element accessory protein TnpB [Acidimicrobiia bacterium]